MNGNVRQFWMHMRRLRGLTTEPEVVVPGWRRAIYRGRDLLHYEGSPYVFFPDVDGVAGTNWPVFLHVLPEQFVAALDSVLNGTHPGMDAYVGPVAASVEKVE